MLISFRPSWFVTFSLFLTLAVVLQWWGGAYRSEFGETEDEAAHYVTGLMVRDYLAAGAPWPPMKYAKEYYEHYPKVALGHWPPLYYAAQAIWTLIFNPNRMWVLLLQAVLAAAWAAMFFALVRKVVSLPAAAAGAPLLLLHPLTQMISREVMSGMLTAVLVLAGAAQLLRYLETGSWKHSAVFGLSTGLALLSKGTGALLLGMLPLAALLAGRRELLGRLSSWMSWLIALAIAGPWYLLAPGAWHERATPNGPWAQFRAWRSLWTQLTAVLERWYTMLGPWFTLLAAGGIVAFGLLWLRRRPAPALWAVSAASLPVMAAMNVFVGPARELRHSLLILPFFVILATAGVLWITDLLLKAKPSTVGRAWAASGLMAAVAVVSWQPWRLPPKDYRGYGTVAGAILGKPEWKDAILMVCSDAAGEGMFISELAMREQRPGHRILRASKTLSSSDWLGKKVTLRFHTAGEVKGFLDQTRTGIVVLDNGTVFQPVHRQVLIQALAESSDEWRLAALYPKQRGADYYPEAIQLYVRNRPVSGQPEKIPSQLPRLSRKY